MFWQVLEASDNFKTVLETSEMIASSKFCLIFSIPLAEHISDNWTLPEYLKMYCTNVFKGGRPKFDPKIF